MQVETTLQQRCHDHGGVLAVAERAGIAKSTMYSYTSGRIRIPERRLKALATALQTRAHIVRRLGDEAQATYEAIGRAKERLRKTG